MDEALRNAVTEFRKVHLENIPQKYDGVELVNGKLKIKYLNKQYLVSHDKISCFEEAKEVSKREKIIILHYLTRGSKISPSGKLIDFREIPGGNVYYSVFENRVSRSFLKSFGSDPLLFAGASASAGGERIDFGDAAFRFTVLPGIPITFVLHRGDEEFSPACKILFDSSITEYLQTEDIVVVCEDLVRRLKTSSIKLKDN